MSEGRKKGGFASMSRERVREIARLGGKAAQAGGLGHKFTSEEARAAGAKGGRAPHTRRGRGKRVEAQAECLPSVGP